VSKIKYMATSQGWASHPFETHPWASRLALTAIDSGETLVY